MEMHNLLSCFKLDLNLFELKLDMNTAVMHYTMVSATVCHTGRLEHRLLLPHVIHPTGAGP